MEASHHPPVWIIRGTEISCKFHCYKADAALAESSHGVVPWVMELPVHFLKHVFTEKILTSSPLLANKFPCFLSFPHCKISFAFHNKIGTIFSFPSTLCSSVEEMISLPRPRYYNNAFHLMKSGVTSSFPSILLLKINL